MDRFLAEAATSYFWLTAVLLAVLVNILSSYLKTPLDGVLNRFSKGRKARSEAKAKEIQDAAERLAAHPDEVPYIVASEMRKYLIGLYFLMLSVLILFVTNNLMGLSGLHGLVGVFAQLFVFGVGLGALAVSFVIMGLGIDEGSKLRTARELRELACAV